MPGSHKDNISGDDTFQEIAEKLDKRRNESAAAVRSIIHEASVTSEVSKIIQSAYDELPAVQGYYPSPENVNWLGSSYSGVDIKVIAHLYDTEDLHQSRLDKINKEFQYAKRLFDACDTLLKSFSTVVSNIADTDTWDDKRTIWISGAQLNIAGDDVEQKAINELSALLYTANFRTVIGIAKLRRAVEQLHHAARINKDALSKSVESLEKLQKEGPGQRTVTLATLQTISVQSHREKFAVRALGHSYVKGYTRGQRTIAGSMIFTVFNEHALAELQRAMGKRKEFADGAEISTLLPDQLPPIDLTIVFANEYGQMSELRLYGVEFVNDGITFSIEDLLSENVMQFVARDADVLTDKGKVKLSQLQRGVLEFEKEADSASDLLQEQDYIDYLEKIGIRRRLKQR